MKQDDQKGASSRQQWGRKMGNIVKLKGCKRCGGDLFLERDTEEIRIVCLQCSAVYAQRLVALVKKPVTKSYYAR
jgi:hypothetical protein